MTNTSFYSESELKKLGLKCYGKNVLISRKASIYGAEDISIGNDVRVDDFCILSGKIALGNNIHVSAYSAVFAGNVGIEIDDFVTISSRVMIYAINDDYSGLCLTNPTIPATYRNVISGKVIFRKHAIIGSGCTVLPGVTISEGVAVGAMSLVNKNLDAWGIYAGVPCRYIKPREKKLLEFEKQMKAERNDD
ncbi:MAG: acyltransferase [Synergistaceae bacterium]|nr:acyltransferase [Candidatus Equadaptatus faecalis]